MQLRTIVEVILLLLYLQLALYVYRLEREPVAESEESCLVILHQTSSPLPPPSISTSPSSTPSSSPPPSPSSSPAASFSPSPSSTRKGRVAPAGPSPLPVVPQDRFVPRHNSTRSEYPHRSIAVVTSYFRRPEDKMVDYDRLFQQHVDRSIRYTHLHSYAFFLETSHWQPLDFDKAVWSKLPAVWNHLPHYDWVMWIDADAMFANFDITIDEIIERAESEYQISENNKDFLVIKDMNGLNFGVFLIRNTPWAHDFLHRAWDMQRQPNIEEEQHAVKVLLQKNPEDAAHTQFVPQRWMNSYTWDVLRVYNLPRWQVEQAQYHPGDFIVHTPGLSIRNKLASLARELSPELPDINIAPGQSIHWGLAVQPFKLE